MRGFSLENRKQIPRNRHGLSMDIVGCFVNVSRRCGRPWRNRVMGFLQNM